jgi:hypothetical protein
MPLSGWLMKCVLGSITGYIIHFILQHSCYWNILLLSIGAGCGGESVVIFHYSRILEAQERKEREREREQKKIKLSTDTLKKGKKKK